MKQYKAMMGMVLLAATVMLAGGCKMAASSDYDPFLNIHMEEVAHLTEDTASPYCDFCASYAYLNEKGDSVKKLINRTVQRELLGEAYASLYPVAALDSFKNDYLRNYRKETGELYRTDMEKKGMAFLKPEWYRQIYSLATFVEEGHKGTINVSATFYCDMGGAHPNQWNRWMNFDGTTGRMLTREDVFPAEAKADIERMLLAKLIGKQSELYPDETIATLEDLHRKGILQLTDIYIPENFLLVKDEVLFLFNRYDIAPYSAGTIVLGIDDEEIGGYLKLN